MEYSYPIIKEEETGDRIRALMAENNLTVKDIQEAMGFDYPQAIYKWLRGESVPKVDNLLMLSVMFHKTINEILVYDEDFDFYSSFFAFSAVHF